MDDRCTNSWSLLVLGSEDAESCVQVQLPDKVYAMDVVYPLMVVGTAERNIHVINLTNPGEIYKVSGKISMSYQCLFGILIMVVLRTDHSVATKVANAVHFVLPQRHWLCYGLD